MPSAQDPFYVVKEEIQESVSFKFVFGYCQHLDLSIFEKLGKKKNPICYALSILILVIWLISSSII